MYSPALSPRSSPHPNNAFLYLRCSIEGSHSLPPIWSLRPTDRLSSIQNYLDLVDDTVLLDDLLAIPSTKLLLLYRSSSVRTVEQLPLKSPSCTQSVDELRTTRH